MAGVDNYNDLHPALESGEVFGQFIVPIAGIMFAQIDIQSS